MHQLRACADAIHGLCRDEGWRDRVGSSVRARRNLEATRALEHARRNYSQTNAYRSSPDRLGGRSNEGTEMNGAHRASTRRQEIDAMRVRARLVDVARGAVKRPMPFHGSFSGRAKAGDSDPVRRLFNDIA
jgi:hypothetical protein